MTPDPGTALISLPAVTSRPPCAACATIARAIGWSVPMSTRAAARMTSFSSTPTAMTDATVGLPEVSVPVLSNTIVSMRRVLSRTSVPRIMIPLRAPRPVPTSKAMGVASPSAHGHATTSVDTATAIARETSPLAHHQPIPANTASAMTTGTKTADIWSTSFCTGAFAA